MVPIKKHPPPSSSSSESWSEEEDNEDDVDDVLVDQGRRRKQTIFGRGGQPPPRENSIMSLDDVSGGKGGASNAANSAAAAARAGVFDALRVEMEYAEYARGETGQRVKRVPRNQAPDRTTKRRALQEADMMEMAIEVDQDNLQNDGKNKLRRRRLRGSKVCFDATVLNSMPALPNIAEWKEDLKKSARGAGSKEGGDSGEALNEDLDERYEVLQEVAALGIDLGLGEIDKLDDDYEVGGEENGSIDDAISSSSEYDESGDEQDEKEAKTISSSTSIERGNVSVSADGLIKPKKRLMHRLRELTSIRLAEKHGEAIGAHIRGASETAVQKLREVCRVFFVSLMQIVILYWTSSPNFASPRLQGRLPELRKFIQV
jgi:hypothetical protein